jgi:hypothetical protein
MGALPGGGLTLWRELIKCDRVVGDGGLEKGVEE